MERDHEDNIHWGIGWVCGAIFLAAPIVMLLYLLRHRRRPAIQAALVCVVSLPFIIGVRALMLTLGVQHNRSQWTGLNALVLIVFPLLATRAAWMIPWPRSRQRN